MGVVLVDIFARQTIIAPDNILELGDELRGELIVLGHESLPVHCGA